MVDHYLGVHDFAPNVVEDSLDEVVVHAARCATFASEVCERGCWNSSWIGHTIGYGVAAATS